MISAAATITVDEYLSTSYSPDCDYVDGVVEERNLGTKPHSRLQYAFQILLSKYEESDGIWIYPEQRVQTKLTCFRIPDVCVTLDRTEEVVFRLPPFLCIEVLSPEDRMSRVDLRISEYFQMGVRFVWVVDPVSHEAWTYSGKGKTGVTDGVLRTEQPEMIVTLDELFRIAERR